MKMTMVMDGNHAFTSTVYALHRANSLHGQLLQVLEYKFNRYARMYGYDKIFFVSDSGRSWRYDVFSTYKSKRSKDKEIDWKYAYEVYEEFKRHLVEKDLAIVLEGDGIEGDDWIYLVVKKSNANGMGTVIVSGDSDMHQLLDYDSTAPWINIQLEGNIGRIGPETAVVHESYMLIVDAIAGGKTTTTDVFDLKSDTNSILEGLTGDWQVKTVDPKGVLFKKLLTGDTTDDVPSPYKYEQNTKNGPRLIGIGEASASKILKIHNGKSRTMDPSDPRFIKDTIESICECDTYKKRIEDGDKDSIRNGIALNRRMIFLDHRNYSAEIKSVIADRLKGVF